MNLTVNIPDELYKQAETLAEAQHVSVDQVIASAFAEQLLALNRLKSLAERGNREDFLRVLDKVPDIEPDDFDRL
ncbi:MAG TPA: hypothetical protein VG345_01260 [Bryobacteraceae bacterium]|jgi:predicted transcriptional regulator|nr:hypothetical protein [Bryobacteraceae bacterium]